MNNVNDIIDGMTPIDGGFHVKDLNDEHCVDVMRLAYDWRVVLGRRGHVIYDHGWCYFGHGHDENGHPRSMHTARLRAIAAAIAWDGTGSPDGYDKQAC